MRSLPPFSMLGLLAAGALLPALGAPADTSAASGAADSVYIPRYIFAVEDTLDLPPFFEMREQEVVGERLTIGEIVERCIQGEEKRRARIARHSFTQIVKSIMHVGGYGENARKLLIVEDVQRVEFIQPDSNRTVLLKHDEYAMEKGHRVPWDREKERSRVDIRYSDLNDLPFYLEEKEAYRFQIVSRRLMEDRVLYEVKLEPRSEFAIAPSGRIWVDTAGFQILREEFDFGDKVPMPLFVKSIGPFIRERERIGDVWVWKRFLVRVDLRIGWVPFLGEDVPDVIEFVINFRDHELEVK
jgi:hypothetical protein